ncbi:bifunctional 3-(3-hydroxy-phenyl)propionate/3-hydroxycinnamic acid hydroxylase [Actinomadura sp. 9N407]|uniref:bifunctional 3-(3-hydroxy-phenyl)propionate/3-hydroxycinnamic acid hydroxylase n=1 Tax=Actinomadura sp. 9N407 TaxID=3375154 RepID=UPI00379CB1EB
MLSGDAEAGADVVVVGCGPVGQLTAILLGTRGWRVVVVERWPEPYPLPRAVTFDHEAARLLAAAGLGDRLGEISEAAREYEWRNAAGQVLLRFEWDRPGISGWPWSSMFSQPRLEALLAERMVQIDGLRVRPGLEVVGVVQSEHRAEVTVRDAAGHLDVISASYVIGCDGANSTVRRHMTATVTDLGFRYDWLIVDVVPDHEGEWTPSNLQICDPLRPTTVVSGGPGRRRFEFMRLPHETAKWLDQAETAWSLIEPWGLTPSNAVLERHAVYTFQARWADQWRDGRLLLAGDAAHLMPPFAGQGMCSGLRDAANLAWKLDLVLARRAVPELLDSYTVERSAHVQQAIQTSIQLGKVICVLDDAAAAERDQAMGAATGGTVVDTIPDAALSAGVLHCGPDGTPGPAAGELSPQGHVSWNGAAGPFDQVVGTGFVIAALFDPAEALTDQHLAFCTAIGARLVRLAATGKPVPGAVTDSDGVYHALLNGTGRTAVIVRPDFYVFGTATADDLGDLVDDLRDRLTGRPADRPPASDLLKR